VYDAIVVGARCAGASTAMLLARRGYRVLLVDRSRFPSDTMSTLYIHQQGVGLLDTWGILDGVIRSGTKKLDKVTYGVPGVRLHGNAPDIRGIGGTYAPRRRILDQLIVDAAVKAGAEFRDGVRVIGLLHDVTGRVCGVRLRGTHAAEYEEKAQLVVGADGMRSIVADLAEAAIEREDPLMSCVYYSLWENLTADFEFYERPGNWVSVIPTNDNLTAVSAYFPQSKYSKVRTDPATWFNEAVRETAPDIHERIEGTQPIERLRGTGAQRNFFRKAWGPGWALVGDAGCHKDTITARGITDAFVQADLLALAVGDNLSDPHRLDSALETFSRSRNEVLDTPYRSALALAALNLTESRLAMLRAISESEALTTLYFSVVGGVKTMEDLFTPELLANW